MAYKKYIKKNGKIYGPYLYHSRRVDDKVISEYYGHEKKRTYKKLLFSVIFVALIFLAIYGFNYIEPYFSGKAIFDLDANYQEGQPLDGLLKLSLKQGEMVPASAKIILESDGEIAEARLNEVVLEEESEEGNFYIEGVALSGTGEGYGFAGEKVIWPVVHFTLEVYSSKDSEGSSNSGDSDTPFSQEVIEESEQAEQIEETSQTEPIWEGAKEAKKEKIEIDVEKEKKNKESLEESPRSITGNFASLFFKGVSNFFLRITGTGKAALDFERTVEANASRENPFIYPLQEGEILKLKEGSVYIVDSLGEKKVIEDSLVSIDILTDRAVVNVDYSEIEYGFGEDYFGQEEKIIYINLSSFEFFPETDKLSIILDYGGQEIISLKTSLKEGKVVSEEFLSENLSQNETEILNQSNETFEVEMEFVSSSELSQEEKSILENHFGNLSVETTKSEIFKGRLLRNYKLGDYEIEYSYDYSGGVTSELQEQMHEDLMKWLRDIINELSKEESVPEAVPNLLGNYSLNGNETGRGYEENFSEG